MWHQDESGHGGLHRWHLSGLDTISAVSVLMSEIKVESPTSKDVLNIDVRNYGAVGDGTTDDSAAFEKAFAAASKAISPATVFVPGPFRYVIANVSLPTNSTLTGHPAGIQHAPVGEEADSLDAGAPDGAPVIVMHGSAAFAIQVNSSTALSAIRFEGSSRDTHSPITSGLVHSPHISDVVIERCSFADTSRGGIITDHTHHFSFRNNVFTNVGEGMDIQFSHDGMITGNLLQNISHHGIQFWGNFNNKVQDSSNLTFAHNTVKNVSGGADIWGTGAIGVTFESNDVDGAGDVALDCEWCTGVLLRNNTVRNGHNAAISLFQSCNNVTITNNSIWMWEDEADTSGLGYGIWLTGTNAAKLPGDIGHRNVSISGNTIYALGKRHTPEKYGKGTTKHAIAVQSGTLISLRDNHLFNGTDVLLDVDMH